MKGHLSSSSLLQYIWRRPIFGVFLAFLMLCCILFVEEEFFADEIQQYKGLFNAIPETSVDVLKEPSYTRLLLSRGQDPSIRLDERFLRLLAPFQFPEVCDQDTPAYLSTIGGIGFGASMAHVTAEFSMSIINRWTFTYDYPTNFQYGNLAECPHDMDCFFLPVSSCKAADLDREGPAAQKWKQNSYSSFKNTNNPFRLHRNLGDQMFAHWECGHTHYVPPQFRSAGSDEAWHQMRVSCDHSFLARLPGEGSLNGLEVASQQLAWFRAQQYGYLLSPTPEIMDLIYPVINESRILDYTLDNRDWSADSLRSRHFEQEIKRNRAAKGRDPGFGKGVIALHIRRGDKVGTEDKLHTVPEYMKLAEELRALNGSSTIFLATDDQVQVAEEIRQYLLSNESKYGIDWRILHSPAGRNSQGSRFGQYSGTMVSVLTDLWMLTDCDYFVASGSSWFSRLAVFMGIARKHFVSFRFLDSQNLLIGGDAVPMLYGGIKNFKPAKR